MISVAQGASLPLTIQASRSTPPRHREALSFVSRTPMPSCSFSVHVFRARSSSDQCLGSLGLAQKPLCGLHGRFAPGFPVLETTAYFHVTQILCFARPYRALGARARESGRRLSLRALAVFPT